MLPLSGAQNRPAAHHHRTTRLPERIGALRRNFGTSKRTGALRVQDDMDMTQMVERYNATIREQAEEIGKLKAEVEQLKTVQKSLLAERELYLGDDEWIVFEPEWDTAH